MLNLILALLVTLVFSRCGVSDTAESRSAPTVITREDSSHQNTSHASSNVTVSKHNYIQGHKEAGFEFANEVLFELKFEPKPTELPSKEK